MHNVSLCALAQVSGIACLGEGVTSLRASSFMGVVAMETWRPQKVWEENRNMPRAISTVSLTQAFILLCLGSRLSLN